MRGFFAFAPKPAIAEELGTAVSVFADIPGLKLIHPADYHVTIKFLSEFSSTKFFACMDELAAIGKPPVTALTAGNLALWPTVLALEFPPNEELANWHKKVNDLLERRGFLKEIHPRFNPHITVARKKHGMKVAELEARLQPIREKFSGARVELEAPSLWISRPPDTEQRYRELVSPLFR